MKNVCLCMILMLFSISNIFAQELQNANWYFGHHAGVKFTQPSLTPTGLSGSAMDSEEACASVSDDQGNLLFYTNGREVWNRNHTIMPNGTGLKSQASSTQGVIIVPKPGNNNIYYIVTIGSKVETNGLYYSEVNMQLNNSLGDITTIKNEALKDHTGAIIDGNYNNNLSEKLTSTKHANGVDYWVVTQIKNKVYSYLVSSLGFHVEPAYWSTVSVDVSYVNNTSPAIGGMKISPDGTKIGICYAFWVTTLSARGGIAIGSFNNATGQVIINQTVSPNITPYNLEFSPSGQYLYFTEDIYLKRISLSNYSVTLIANVLRGGGLQLGIDNKIYLSCDNDDASISVIHDPDNANAANVVFQSKVIYAGGGTTDYNLPQWVHKQPILPICPSDLTLSTALNNDVLNGQQDLRQASNSITALNIVNNGATGLYHAGNVVYLKPGFNAKTGSNFRAYIEGCSGVFAARIPEEGVEMVTYAEEQGEIAKSFMMSPNPATEMVTIQYDDVISNLTITSMEGLTMFNQAIGKNSYDLYIGNYKRGIYVVTVQTQDGKVLIEKLMKN